MTSGKIHVNTDTRTIAVGGVLYSFSFLEFFGRADNIGKVFELVSQDGFVSIKEIEPEDEAPEGELPDFGAPSVAR